MADGATLPPSLLTDLPNQGSRQLDGKDHLCFWNKQGAWGGLGLLKIAVSLTP
jgi:hypothetical protein